MDTSIEHANEKKWRIALRNIWADYCVVWQWYWRIMAIIICSLMIVKIYQDTYILLYQIRRFIPALKQDFPTTILGILMEGIPRRPLSIKLKLLYYLIVDLYALLSLTGMIIRVVRNALKENKDNSIEQ